MGNLFRERCCLVLGIWHPLKMLMSLIWKRFAPVIWAPLQHFLFAGSRFWLKNAFTDRMNAMFTLVRLAYPQARKKFAYLLENCESFFLLILWTCSSTSFLWYTRTHVSRNQDTNQDTKNLDTNTNIDTNKIRVFFWWHAPPFRLGARLPARTPVEWPSWIYTIMNRALDAMVFLELPQQSLYTKCMFNMLILRHQFDSRTPVWTLFKKDPSTFNEEIGETMLSVLARSTSGSPNKLELEKVRKMFARINKLSEISHMFERSLLSSSLQKSSHQVWSTSLRWLLGPPGS